MATKRKSTPKKRARVPVDAAAVADVERANEDALRGLSVVTDGSGRVTGRYRITSEPATAKIDRSFAAAADRARQFEKSFAAIASQLEDEHSPPGLRDHYERVVYAHACLDLEKEVDAPVSATKKLRALVCVIRACATPVWVSTSQVGVRPADEIGHDKRLQGRIDLAVERIVRGFAEGYPEDASKLDKGKLRVAVLAWRDKAGAKAAGGAVPMGKDLAITLAIRGTSFPMSKDMVREVRVELERKRKRPRDQR